jgi:zinc D-Ala-D-Ala carboxypeptidase
MVSKIPTINLDLKKLRKGLNKPKTVFNIGVFLIIILFIYAYVKIFSLTSEVERLALELNSTNTALMQKTDTLGKGISELDEKAEDISATLSNTEKNLMDTKNNIAAVKSEVGGVQQTVGEISGSVNNLEKLSATDKELLQKYSKTYFLNEHYVPKELKEIEKKYLYNEQKPLFVHHLAYSHLISLLNQSEADGKTIYVKSAYRSFNEQQSLKSAYSVVYGSGANTFSADQGYSEHQLGSTIDFITTGLNGQLKGFDTKSEYQWMLNNAYKYGFTLSYPENNSYYVFEPWHWRYVGIKLATYLHNQNKNFYDLEQREIDEYLLDLLD